MRVIVTRPEREARQWVHDLSLQGFDAVALPLIQIGPVHDSAELLQAWQQLADYLAVMFVSGNAAEQFFISKRTTDPVFTAQAAIKTRAWATGPGTAGALLRAGVAPERLDAPPLDGGQFDSEALWQVVAPQVRPGDRVLIVRGGDASAAASVKAQGTGRDWFARQVAQAGAQADFLLAYQRSAPQWSAHERELASQAANDGSVWLFSSSEALTNLAAVLGGQSWAGARAVATHPRIAQSARQAGFGTVCESRPTLADVVAAIRLCP